MKRKVRKKVVKLPKATVLAVVVPKAHVPVVVHDPVKNVVEIVPVKKKPMGFWASIFSAG